MEQNTFKSLLSRLSFDNILPAFKAIYQKLRPDLFEQTDWNIYQDIYQDLRTHEADTSQYFILIFERWEDASYPGSNCCVGYEEGDNYDYRAIIGGYPFLSEILGMEITISNGITLTPQELAAGLLWEITYYGGSEEMAKYNFENEKLIETSEKDEKGHDIYEDKRWRL